MLLGIFPIALLACSSLFASSAITDSNLPPCASKIETIPEIEGQGAESVKRVLIYDKDAKAPNTGLQPKFQDQAQGQYTIQNSGSNFYFYLQASGNSTISSVEAEDGVTYEENHQKWPNIQFSDDTDAGWDVEKSFRVEVDCNDEDYRRMVFSLNATVTSYATVDPTTGQSTNDWECAPVSFFWQMECGGQVEIERAGFMVGTTQGGSNVVRDGKVTKQFKKENFVVGPDVTATTFFITMQQSEFSAFMDDEVYISPMGVAVNYDHAFPILSDDGIGGGWIDQLNPKQVTITYNCKVKNGKKVPIEMDFEIPYFSSPHIKFYKQCGYPGTVKHSKMYYFVMFLLFAAAVYTAGILYKYFCRDESGLDALPFYDEGQEFVRWVQKKMKTTSYSKGPFEQEIPDIDEPMGGMLQPTSNVKGGYNKQETNTKYGSI